MNSSEVKQVLREKGVEYLYHANSVLTSISYLENGGLMSREYVEECDYPQTPQVTDDTDKEFEIYNDIFLDSVDVHALSKNVNFYGPVLFVYSIDVLDEVSDYDICVTRTNAIYWSEKNTPANERYYNNINELRRGFTKGNFGQSITIRNISRPLSFKYLAKVILEDPGEDNQGYLNRAFDRLNSLLDSVGKEDILEIRQCENDCRCLGTYGNYKPAWTFHRFKLWE